MILRPEGTQTITTGTASTISTGVGLVLFNPTTTMATYTATFPTAPNDRDDLFILFGGVLTGGTVVTILSIVSAIGIIGTLPTTAVAGLVLKYQYIASLNKWFQI